MAWLLGACSTRLVPGTLLFLLFQSLLLLGGLLALLCAEAAQLAERGRGAADRADAAMAALPGRYLERHAVRRCRHRRFRRAGAGTRAGRIRPGLIAGLLLLALAAAVRQNGVVLSAGGGARSGVDRAAQEAGWPGLRFSGRQSWSLLLSVNLALASRSDGGDGATAEIRLAQSYDLAGALSPANPICRCLAAQPDLDRLLRRRGARALHAAAQRSFRRRSGLSIRRVADAPDGAICRRLESAGSGPSRALSARAVGRISPRC